MMNYDFALERKLRQENAELHRIFTDNARCIDKALQNYQTHFPEFTDHSSLHSLTILGLCNELIGENISMLNADEIFILLMGIYLHDIGMGISIQDFEKFASELPQVSEYLADNPDADDLNVIRAFHNEFSGMLIRKYSMLFDFPSDEHLFCVIQTARGHRVTDLHDENEYPKEVVLNNGNVVHMPYLAALIRLADELDIAKNRNPKILYNIGDLKSERQIIEWKKHEAVKRFSIEPDCFRVEINCSDGIIREKLNNLFEKVSRTMSECVKVIDERTLFSVSQNEIVITEV